VRAQIKRLSAQMDHPNMSISSSTESCCPEIVEVESKLQEYLIKNFTPKHAKDLTGLCEKAVMKLQKVGYFFFMNSNSFQKRLPLKSDLAEMIQIFYGKIMDRATKFGPINAEFNLPTFLERVESFVCVQAYDVLFCTR
jgi:hypothetical protein